VAGRNRKQDGGHHVATRGSPTRGGKGIFLARPAEKETGIKTTDRSVSTFLTFL